MNPHGKIEFYWLGTILVVNFYGPFNEEGIAEAIAALRKTVTDKNFRYWSRLGIFDKESLGSPKTFELLKQSYQWFEDHGCLHTAVVAETSLLKQLLQSSIIQRIEFFDSEEEAKQWLAKMEKRA